MLKNPGSVHEQGVAGRMESQRQGQMTRGTTLKQGNLGRQVTLDQGKLGRQVTEAEAGKTRAKVDTQGQATRDAVSLQGNATRNTVNTQAGRTRDAMSKGFAGTNAAVGDLSSQVGTGFANTAADMSSGFANTAADMSSGFANVAGQVGSGFEGASQERQAGFTNLQDFMSGGFENALTQLGDARTAIMDGQAGLTDALQTNRQQSQAFYEGLAGGQAGIQTGVDGLQSGLTDFRSEFDEQSGLARDQRGEIASSMESGFAATQDDISGASSAAEQGQQRLMSAVGGPSVAESMGGFAQMPQAGQQAPTQNGQAAGAGGPQAGQQATPEQVNRLLSQAVEMSMNPNIEPNARRRFGVMATSFNEAGELIPQTTFETGTTVLRQIDNNGNLAFRSFDRAGNSVGSGAVNIAETMREIDMTGRQTQIPGGQGFATPFTRTM